MAQYVRISDEEMDSFMNALGFRELSRESRGLRVKEKVYERPFDEGRIRVYSSVEDSPWKASVSRKKGRDAIRVQYWVDDTKVFGAKRVHRVVNWRRNMLNRVYEIEDMFGHRSVPRDSSGEPMVIRTSKEGKKFWGSRNFPRNKDTRRFNAYISRSGHVRPSMPTGRRRLLKKSCCCGANEVNPCACMKKGVMTCRADEPKCPCYAAKTEVKEAVVIAPRKPTGIVDAVMMNHAMLEEAQLQEMLNYLENMVQLGLLNEEEVMKELYKTFGSEYYFDGNLEDIVMDEYLEDEDYEDAEIYARAAVKKLNAEDWAKTGDKCYLCRHGVFTNAMGKILILNECLNCGRYGHEGCGHPTSTGYYCARCYDSGHSAAETFHPRQKGTCVACGGKFSWNKERCLDCGSGANLWSFDTESFGVEAWDLDITTKFWFCAACNDRYENQSDAEECCLESSYLDERGYWRISHAEAEVRCKKCGKHSLGCPHDNEHCSVGSCCSNHDLCGPHCAICSIPVKDVYLELTECESCLDLVCSKDYNFTDDGCLKCNPVTPDGQNQEEFFRDKFYESERMAQEASDYPLNHLGFWFNMADEPYGGDIRDMLEKPWNWRQEMTRYLFEGGFEGVIYGDDEDLFALGFDASYPPYLTLKELGELYDWMPTYEDYKGYVHNYYRAEYEEVTNSPLGIIVKDADGKTYVLVPEDLAQIIFERSKYVLDAEWRKDELLYPDELNLGMIPVGGTTGEKLYVATRNEGEEIITYVVKEETIDNEKLYRILVVIEMDGHETMMIVANTLNQGVPNE